MQNTCGHCCTKIEGLSVTLGNRVILDKVNLHLNCHEILALIGPNGAGKSTLFRAIIGELPYSGKFNFLVKSKPGKIPLIGYVPQKVNFESDSPISVLDLVSANISRSPVWVNIKKKTRRKAMDILKKFECQGLMDRKIGQLSGGELQRVLLGIAMTPVPDLLLLDEPVSAVDIKGAALFYQIVNNLKKEYDISIIMVTHNLAGIIHIADRVVLLNRTIIAEGSPKQITQDKTMAELFLLSV